jgi:flagellar basal-body rod protein FlgC
MFRMLAVAAGGLSAQRARMEVAAQNIANAETTRTTEGGPYQRKTVALETAPADNALLADPDAGAIAFKTGGSDAFGAEARSILLPVLDGTARDAGGVRVAGIGADGSEGALVYDPGHPDADEKGYVRMPNVRVTDEMMEMMDARRVYDANATVFQSAKSMLRRALEL